MLTITDLKKNKKIEFNKQRIVDLKEFYSYYKKIKKFKNGFTMTYNKSSSSCFSNTPSPYFYFDKIDFTNDKKKPKQNEKNNELFGI